MSTGETDPASQSPAERGRIPVWLIPAVVVVIVAVTAQTAGARTTAVVLAVVVAAVASVVIETVWSTRPVTVAVAALVGLAVLGALWWQQGALTLSSPSYPATNADPRSSPSGAPVDWRARRVTQNMVRGARLRGADLAAADLSGLDLRGVDLTGADLAGANLTGTDLYGVPLVGADLRGTRLRDACLRFTDFTGAAANGADAAGADLTHAFVPSGVPAAAASWPTTPNPSACPI